MSGEAADRSSVILSRRTVLSLGAAAGLTFVTRSGATGAELAEEAAIPMLMPRDREGRHFVLYSDCCSGVPGAPNERTHAAVNEVVRRIDPSPEFIAFPGDAVTGYTSNYDELRAQWDYWMGTEMAWLKRKGTPLYQSTSNHNTYDWGSEAVFREVHRHLPQSGPEEQRGLAYFIRDGNLLYVSTHQPDRTRPYRQDMLIDTQWLADVLEDHADARFKFVVGHYPVFPVNSYTEYPQWCFPPKEREGFWSVLVKHGVSAYLCSHILAFDVQLHNGLLQILSGGAGTGLMPATTEYLHAVQMAIDEQGLRCRVLDVAGNFREYFCWPVQLPKSTEWQPLEIGQASTATADLSEPKGIVAWRFQGVLQDAKSDAAPQTVICGWDTMEGCATVHVTLEGCPLRLTVRLVPRSGYGCQQWVGPIVSDKKHFDVQLALHPGLGPGGVLYRESDISPWNSLQTTSTLGVDQLTWPKHWAVGHAQSGPSESPYIGEKLSVTWTRVLEPVVNG